jgi:hypothetical protein
MIQILCATVYRKRLDGNPLKDSLCRLSIGHLKSLLYYLNFQLSPIVIMGKSFITR